MPISMAFKVFLAVNIILDFALQRDGYEPSKTVITWAEEGKINGFVSPTVVQICSYWIEKAYGLKDRKSVVWGKSVSVRVELGGGRFIKKKKKNKKKKNI